MTVSTPGALDATIAALLDGLASPDSEIRDRQSAGQLREMLRSGELTGDAARRLGDALVVRLGHSRIEARSFAALTLVEVVRHLGASPGWFDDVAGWYANERDTAGYDQERGWLHAVAHGADALAAFAHDGTDPAAVLAVAAKRMLVDDPTVWRDQEDERLGYAIAVTLASDALTADAAEAWLAPVRDRFAAAEPGPTPPFASNTIRTLRMVSFLLGRDLTYNDRRLTVRHAAHVDRAIEGLFADVTPWMWRGDGRSYAPPAP